MGSKIANGSRREMIAKYQGSLTRDRNQKINGTRKEEIDAGEC